MRIATYNIHRCIGPDRRFRPERIIAVLNEIQADIVALQEVETLAEDGLNLLARLAGATGLTRYLAGPTLLSGRGHYGNAVLTRLEVQDVERLDISVPGREPRGALNLRLGHGGAVLQVVATHLGLRPAERRSQVRRLLPLFADSQGVDCQVLLGDLNEWFLWGRPLQWLHARFRHNPALPTFPSRAPLVALDRLWSHPPDCLVAQHVHITPTAKAASDHLPLVADLGL